MNVTISNTTAQNVVSIPINTLGTTAPPGLYRLLSTIQEGAPLGKEPMWLVVGTGKKRVVLEAWGNGSNRTFTGASIFSGDLSQVAKIGNPTFTMTLN